MRKINLLLNKSFKTIDFNDCIDDSIYGNSSDNLLNYSASIVLTTKPDNNYTYEELNVGEDVNCYLFPMSNNNYKFNLGDILYTHDNLAIFVIKSHIEDNKFSITLIKCEESTYELKNSTTVLMYNELYEKYTFNNNSSKALIKAQKNEYTDYINENSEFVSYVLEQFVITSSDSTITTVFTFEETDNSILFTNIINKFHLNILLFDYNDFKYIYSSDIKNADSTNTELSSTNLIAGVLNSLQTKIKPHFSSKLIKGNTYSFTTDTINKYTSFSKEYDNDKLIIITQLTLDDKSTVYDQENNVESDYMYIIL